MPTNRPPRGGKPTTGRSAAGPRKGGRSEGTRGGAERGPSAGPARGGRSASGPGAGRASASKFAQTDWGRTDRPTRSASGDARSDRPARGGSSRTEAPRSGRSESPRGRSEAPRGARTEGGRSDRPTRTRGATPAAGRSERPVRAPRAEAAPRYEERAPRFVEVEEDESFGGTEGGRDMVFGRHPVLALLEGDQPVNKVWILRTLANRELVNKVKQLAKEKGASVQLVERPKLDALTLDENHQGLVASVASAGYKDLDEVIEIAKAAPYPALLMLDGIEDPHNLGALIRTAEGAGFQGVIIPSRRAVGLTPTVHKSSAGALARMPVARVGNLAQAVETLHAAGFWLAGADARGKSLPYEIDMTVPLVVVIGAEGKGLSKLLGDKCDWLVHLELGGELESLNASVAGGVLMYEAVRQRWVKGQSAPGPETAGG